MRLHEDPKVNSTAEEEDPPLDLCAVAQLKLSPYHKVMSMIVCTPSAGCCGCCIIVQGD